MPSLLEQATAAVDDRFRALAGQEGEVGILGPDDAFAPVFIGMAVPFPDAVQYCRHTVIQTAQYAGANNAPPLDVLLYGMLMRTFLTGMMAIEIHHRTGD